MLHVKHVQGHLIINALLAIQILICKQINASYVLMENMVVELLIFVCLATKNAKHAKEHKILTVLVAEILHISNRAQMNVLNA